MHCAAVDIPHRVTMQTYIMRTELARIFSLDSRTITRRFNLLPAGYVVAGSKRFKIYNYDAVKTIQDKIKAEQENQ
jgi:hypothetical protein